LLTIVLVKTSNGIVGHGTVVENASTDFRNKFRRATNDNDIGLLCAPPPEANNSERQLQRMRRKKEEKGASQRTV
jgi:hypothetical protein